MYKNSYRVIKRWLKYLVGKDIFMSRDVSCNTLRLGSDYGGWVINPDMLDQNSVVYSVGVGEDISFDLELIDKFDVSIQAFDPTPRSINWVKQQNTPNAFHLHEYGLADFDGEIQFNPPANPNHISHTIIRSPGTEIKAITLPVKSLGSIMSLLGHETVDLLKMDIEGAEYSVVDDIIQRRLFPKQLLIEFHHRFPSVGLEQTKLTISKLSSVGYKIFSISPSGEEFSFLLEI